MRRYLFIAAWLLASTEPARCQEIFGSIQGIVSDETGAVIPGARVTARNTVTGAHPRRCRIRVDSISWVSFAQAPMSSKRAPPGSPP